MSYVWDIPFFPVEENSCNLEGLKDFIRQKQVIECDKVAILKKKRKLLVGSYYKAIIDWLLANPDSFEIVRDFKGYDFGVELEERLGRVYFRCPLIFDKEWYKGYSVSAFQKLGIEEKLQYIKNDKNYIPVKILEESFYADNLSHMWSHIKNNKEVMKDLERYLQTSRFVPRFQVFYFIRYDSSKDMVYLKRDYFESPKEESESNFSTKKVDLPDQIGGEYIPKKKKSVEEDNSEVVKIPDIAIESELIKEQEVESQTYRIEPERIETKISYL